VLPLAVVLEWSVRVRVSADWVNGLPGTAMTELAAGPEQVFAIRVRLSCKHKSFRC
jgi:hypothetical protein